PLQNPSAADKIRTRQGGSADQSFASGADIPGQWWTLFHSKALNRLVEQALANNPTLEAAQASLRVAQQNALAQKGTLYPSLTATPQIQGAQAPGLDLQSPLNNQNQYLYSLSTPQAVVS
ncbi:TolC family protein, partial [Escherichia coli]|nr:TolC family protein [Escherichia coli]